MPRGRLAAIGLYECLYGCMGVWKAFSGMTTGTVGCAKRLGGVEQVNGIYGRVYLCM